MSDNSQGFDFSANGVYRVEVSTVYNANGLGSGDPRKSDNFKVETVVVATTGSVGGTKWEDRDGSATTTGDRLAGLGGFTIFVDVNGDTLNNDGFSTTMAVDGTYSISGVPAGTYSVYEVSQAGYTVVVGSVAGVSVSAGTNTPGVNFANFKNVTICGVKFYDANTDGIKGAGEPTIAGWRVGIDTNGDTTPDYFTVTDATGSYCFGDLNGDGKSDLGPGTYTVSEGTQPNWVATTPTSAGVTVGGTTGVQSGGTAAVNFGNVNLAQCGGLTLGFWSNPNGKVILQANDSYSNPNNWRAVLNALNLRNATGVNFDVSNTGTRTGADSFTNAYAAFRTWILGATATNMSYMLSAQMAATTLDVKYAGLDANALIYVPGITGWSSNPQGASLLGNLYSNGTWTTTGNFVKLSEVLSNANAVLGANGSILSGNPLRVYAEALKIVCDAVNNSNSNNANSPGRICVAGLAAWNDANHNGVIDQNEGYGTWMWI